MLASAFRASLGGTILVLMPFLYAAAQDAPRNAAEQQRIEQAFASRLKAEQEAAKDRLILGKTTALLNDAASPVLGNPKGDVTVVEFFDYACPYCKAIEPRLQKFLKDDKGAKLILKELPILTPESLVATKAALASVKQGKYEAFHNALMAFKGQLTSDAIFDTAKAVRLDVTRLRKDMETPDIADSIIANFNLARGLRLFETPSFVAGGHMLSSTSADIDFPKVAAAIRAK
jgi:protein-disulfide isomerase